LSGECAEGGPSGKKRIIESTQDDEKKKKCLGWNRLREEHWR